MAVSTALFAVATGASRLVGMLREAATAWIFTRAGRGDQRLHRRVPDPQPDPLAGRRRGARRGLRADLQRAADEGRARARLARGLDRLVALVRGALGRSPAIAMVLAPQLLALFGYHGALGVGLARVIFPTVVMLGLNGLQTAILNALDEFFLPAIAPVAWNLVIVGTLVLSLPFLHTTDAAPLRVRHRDPARHGRPARDPVSGDAPPRPPELVLRPARRGRAARLRAHAAGHARPRADQPQPARQHVLRGAASTTTSARPPSTRPSASTCCRRACSRWRWPPCCSRRSRGARPRATARASARSSASGLRQIAFLLTPGRRDLRRARDADRAPALRARQLHAAPDGRRRLVPRGLLARARVQRRDAAAQPRVLQHAAGLGADLHRDREPDRQRHARLGALELGLGVWSIPLATSIANIFGVGLLYLELRPLAGRLDERELRARARAHRASRPRSSIGRRRTACGAASTRCSASSCSSSS